MMIRDAIYDGVEQVFRPVKFFPRTLIKILIFVCFCDMMVPIKIHDRRVYREEGKFVRYAFVTISDGTETICEGTANSLSKILNFHDLDIRSFFVSEAEDGSIQADVQIRTGGAHAVTG